MDDGDGVVVDGMDGTTLELVCHRPSLFRHPHISASVVPRVHGFVLYYSVLIRTTPVGVTLSSNCFVYMQAMDEPGPGSWVTNAYNKQPLYCGSGSEQGTAQGRHGKV